MRLLLISDQGGLQLVDFSKQLKVNKIEKELNPINIYNKLDRASDKGPLRPPQEEILNTWFNYYTEKKDTILKLHTGQGKTLVGLLMLQSNMNKHNKPVVFVCPNKHLVLQTAQQAHEFGINYCLVDSNNKIPDTFFNSEAILIVHVQVIFNGLSKFGIGHKSKEISMMVIDDAHASIDSIKQATRIYLTKKKSENVFNSILELFSEDIKKQGLGTYNELKESSSDKSTLIPYWAWKNKIEEITTLLSRNRDKAEIRYVWDLLKDVLVDCDCYISGKSIEIIPYTMPIEEFGSFDKATNRVFMSATINDDSILIKEFGLSPEAITSPLAIKNEHWSGEKMILIPSLIDESIQSENIVKRFGLPWPKQPRLAKLALVPSFSKAEDWEKFGSIISKKETIINDIKYLKSDNKPNAVVFTNRYDGIDLPDSSCRILIIDSLPFLETLEDKYIESVLPNSDIILKKQAQKIEQGMGRSVRGEKDYSVIMLIGSDLVRFIKSNNNKKYFSNQTLKQIEIGHEITQLSKSDIAIGQKPINVLISLINQSLQRDMGWKQYYGEHMDQINNSVLDKKHINKLTLEREFETEYKKRNVEKSVNLIQSFIDNHVYDKSEKGWYLQKKAKYQFLTSISDSITTQNAAHKSNSYLLLPENNKGFIKLTAVSWHRMENIKNFLFSIGTFEELNLFINDVLTNLSFGMKSDKFEKALDEIGIFLGFKTQRPDKESKKGPDNLWFIGQNQYIMYECKNEVNKEREFIFKSETGQMNNSIAWFNKNYSNSDVKNIMIIDTKKVTPAGGFNQPVSVIKNKNLNKFKRNIKNFSAEFNSTDFNNLSSEKIQEYINVHKLDITSLLNLYTEEAEDSLY